MFQSPLSSCSDRTGCPTGPSSAEPSGLGQRLQEADQNDDTVHDGFFEPLLAPNRFNRDRERNTTMPQQFSSGHAPPSPPSVSGDHRSTDVSPDRSGHARPVISDAGGSVHGLEDNSISSSADDSDQQRSLPSSDCGEGDQQQDQQQQEKLGGEEDRQESSLDSDVWETDDDGDTDALCGLLRELEEEHLIPPPNQPLYQHLHDDLLQRVLKVKKERYSFSTDVGDVPEPEHSNPDDLPPDQLRWRHVGDYQISGNMPSSLSCREYAHHHMKMWRHGAHVSKSQVESTLHFNAHRMQKAELNGPGNANNRFPPSIYACQEILHVPDAKTYEFHVCPRGCVHWWGFMEHTAQHLKHCKGCAKCQCPHCNAERFCYSCRRTSIRVDQHVEPSQKCWFFFDVFHHMFLDTSWVAAVNRSREQKLSAFHQTKEDSRLDDALELRGFDRKKVIAPSHCQFHAATCPVMTRRWWSLCSVSCSTVSQVFQFLLGCYPFQNAHQRACTQALKCEVAADGIQWSEQTGRNSNFYVLKSKDAPPHIASKEKYVQPLLIIPNEKAPVTVFTVMVLMLFVVMSPMTGACL